MDILDVFEIAVPAQRGFDHFFEDTALVFLGQRHGASQKIIGQFRMQFVRPPREVEELVDIAAAVIEGGEEETCIRPLHSPVAAAVEEAHFIRIVAEPFLEQDHRADAAQDKIIDIVGGVLHVDAVRCPAGDIIESVCQQDQIFVGKLSSFDHAVKKSAEQGAVVKAGLL